MTDVPYGPMDPSAAVPMPKEIATAIVTVMRGVGRVAQDAKNTHGGYAYTSTDAFLAAVNPACAEAGLIVVPIEMANSLESVEVVSRDGKATTRRMTRMTFAFQLIHESGAVWMHPSDRRTVMVDHTGAQSYGAAQSYALKQFLRGLFLVATGDPDADATEQHQADLIRATVRAVKAKRETGEGQVLIDFGTGLENIAASDVTSRVLAHMAALGDAEACLDWWGNQKHGREQFHNEFPKLALDLKRKVEAFVTSLSAEAVA